MVAAGSWLILGKFKIQINPINLTFPGGRKFMMQSYMQHPGRLESLYFCYLPDFQEDFESWHLKSQTKYPSASSMNLLAGIVALHVIDICQNCNPYFCSSVIDICQKCNRLRQMPVVWMRFIYNSMHFRFGNNRCCLPRQEIICLFIYCTIWFPETFSSKWIINCFHHFCSKLAKTSQRK